MVKPIELEQDEKISFALDLFVFEIQIFQHLRSFLRAKPIRLNNNSNPYFCFTLMLSGL